MRKVEYNHAIFLKKATKLRYILSRREKLENELQLVKQHVMDLSQQLLCNSALAVDHSKKVTKCKSWSMSHRLES